MHSIAATITEDDEAKKKTEMHIKNGRTGLWFLTVILVLKTAVHIFVNGVGGVVYVIPLIIILLAAIEYKMWTGFALYSGLILSVLEFIDFIAGAIGNQSIIVMIMWAVLRISAFMLILEAFKWYRKKKSLVKNSFKG